VPDGFGDILQAAAMAAPDAILVADNERRLVALNAAGAQAFGLPHNALVGRRVEEFFTEIRGKKVSDAWAGFITNGAQCGICVLVTSAGKRKFEYRAKANFAPGLHLGILREVN
jgi:PAS domain-containing protein